MLEFLTARVNERRSRTQTNDLSAFAGAIRLAEDPLEWQRRVRGEWE